MLKSQNWETRVVQKKDTHLIVTIFQAVIYIYLEEKQDDLQDQDQEPLHAEAAAKLAESLK
jgi:hypothetical protein